MRHLALAVHDQERSRRFYAKYLGFDAAPPRRMSDGVLMLTDADGFQLALGETDEPIRLPPFLHFGTRLATPADVRAVRRRLLADGVAIVEEWEEPDYVSVKFLDPDGYGVEVFWEPGRSVTSESLEVVREHFDAFARGDQEAHAATYHRNVEIREPDALPWGGIYAGESGQRDLMERFRARWEEISITPEEIVGEDDVVVARARLRGRTTTGNEVEMPTIEVFRIRGGKIAEQRVFYWDTAALAAAF